MTPRLVLLTGPAAGEVADPRSLLRKAGQFTVAARLLKFVSPQEAENPDACWNWKGVKIPNGYGQLWVSGRMRQAHRVAYELCVGPIPEGLVLDHICRNRACVNPRHLEPVTVAENTLRGNGWAPANARKTHCPAGHPYDEANTYYSPSRPNQRRCIPCDRERMRRFREAKKQAVRAALGEVAPV